MRVHATLEQVEAGHGSPGVLRTQKSACRTGVPSPVKVDGGDCRHPWPSSGLPWT